MLMNFMYICKYCSLSFALWSGKFPHPKISLLPTHPQLILMLRISSNSVVNFHSTFIQNVYIFRRCNIDLEADYIRLLLDSKFLRRKVRRTKKFICCPLSWLQTKPGISYLLKWSWGAGYVRPYQFQNDQPHWHPHFWDDITLK